MKFQKIKNMRNRCFTTLGQKLFRSLDTEYQQEFLAESLKLTPIPNDFAKLIIREIVKDTNNPLKTNNVEKVLVKLS